MNQHRISVGDTYWDFERPVLEARSIADTVVVIFDYMSYPRHQQARNMLAFDAQRKQLWVAEHPTNQTTDTYVSFLSEKPLKAWNFAGFECTIDPVTGKLLHSEFTR